MLRVLHYIRKVTLILIILIFALFSSGCSTNKEKIIIYSSGEDYKIEHLRSRLNERFPEYDISVEYISTGNHAAKLLAEGTNTECDITHDLDYGYMEQLEAEGILADLSDFDKDEYVEDTIQSNTYLPECRSGGAIIINKNVLNEKGIGVPNSYSDLLKPEYKNLISMPNPKSSGTGYMFLKSLVNAWGEKEAFLYFDKLTQNILQYTSSGSGPVNALVQEEVAIGLGMTGQAVTMINEGHPLEIIYFEEGSPYCLYGQSIIYGKEKREAVVEVFDYMVNTINYELVSNFFPEKIYKDKNYTIKNYPSNITYSDMSNNGIEEKEQLLKQWIH